MFCNKSFSKQQNTYLAWRLAVTSSLSSIWHKSFDSFHLFWVFAKLEGDISWFFSTSEGGYLVVKPT